MSQQYGYAYPPAGAEPYPPPEDPTYAQGYYGAQSAAAPPAGGAPSGDQAQLIPGFPTPYASAPGAVAPQAPAPAPGAGGTPPHTASAYVPQQQQQQPSPFPNDPYGGYDAVNYPSIPALVEHARAGGFSSSSAAPQPPPAPHAAPSYGESERAVRTAPKPAEEPGAPNGAARYRVMLLPTRDGGDIENVVAQVGLDGVAFLKPEWRGGGVLDGRSYAMERVAKWSLSDPTILLLTVCDGDGAASSSTLGISADAATVGAVADALVTAAFQWCELRGFDPATAVAEGSRAGEWVNHKAQASAAGDASAGGGSSGAAARQQTPSVPYHDKPEHCGWLSKKGERLRIWRRRWFVLKQGKLGWFKAPADVRAGAKPRGELDMAEVASACTATAADAGAAHGLELIGSAAAEKAGCAFLLADSERECDQWAAALDAVINGAPSSGRDAPGGAGAGGTRAPDAAPAPSAFASQLRDGFERAAAAGHAPGSGASRDIEVSVAGYVSGARGEPAFGNPYVGGSSLPPAGSIQAPSSWETFYTNEGTPYFVNSATGVTQWETPPGVRVDM